MAEDRGHAVHWFSKKHTHLSKNKSPFFFNASSFMFLAFSLVNAAQKGQLEWNSFLDLSLLTKWWLYVQSFPNSHDDSLIPLFGFFSPSFHISALPFQLLYGHSSHFLAHLMAHIYLLLILIRSFLHSRLRSTPNQTTSQRNFQYSNKCILLKQHDIRYRIFLWWFCKNNRKCTAVN